jgi:hypothetical protein
MTGERGSARVGIYQEGADKGNLIESGKTSHVFVGFMIGAVAMILGGVAELLFGVKAERQSLESIAQPLTVEDTGGKGGHQPLTPTPATA